MTLTLTQSATAVAAGIQASFLGIGGTPPYRYAVLGGGAGGTVGLVTGVYVAPRVLSADPAKAYDTIKVVDSTSASATARILIGTPLLLFADIIQKEMGLADGRVYLWDQKINQPSDNDLYVAISVGNCKPYANTNRPSADGTMQEQVVYMQARCDIDIISRGPSARDRKEEVVLALGSVYAEQQQEANSFKIGTLPPSGGFINLSYVDGAAIPYRFRISVNLLYAVSKTKPAQYYDTFDTPLTTTTS